MSNFSKFTKIVLAGLVAAACWESPTVSEPNSQASGALASRRGVPRDVPAVQMDRPPQARAWDTSDVALVAAIAAESGHAVIAFKEVGSARVLETGLRAAVSAGRVTAGLAVLRARGVEIVDLYDAIGAAHVRMDPSLAPILRANPLVDYIEPRQWQHVQGIPGINLLAFVPLGTAQTVPWGIQLVRAPEAWSVTRGAGAKIYLIDSGLDRGHEDLPLVPTQNCNGAFGGCDDAFPIPHGSHVLGIWTARDNTVGVVGVAPGVLAADVYAWGACDNHGDCSDPEITAGINAAIFNADVINMSIGGSNYVMDQANAVAAAWNNNIVLVAAAGNNGGHTISYPANYNHVVGVSGVRPDKSFASSSPCGGRSSNYGTDVDIAAPFWALSTVPGGYADETDPPGWCGTSFAAPHVSGVAALLRAQHPTWTNQEIVDRLLSTAHDLGDPGWDDYYGYGLVDAAVAVGAEPALTVAVDGPSLIDVADVYTWSAMVSGGTGTYTYQWRYQNVGSSGWTPLGTGPTQALPIDGATPDFSIAVTITSDAQARSGDRYVDANVLGVDLSGPTMMGPNDVCWFNATAHGGTPPYTYTWQNGASVETTEGTSYFASGAPVNMVVSVSDAVSGGAEASMNAYLDENGSGCN